MNETNYIADSWLKVLCTQMRHGQALHSHLTSSKYQNVYQYIKYMLKIIVLQ